MGAVTKDKGAKPHFLPQVSVSLHWIENISEYYLNLNICSSSASVCSERFIWCNVCGGLDVLLQRCHSQDDEWNDPGRSNPDRPPRWILDRQHLLHWQHRRLSGGRADKPGCRQGLPEGVEPYWQVLGARMTFILCSPIAALTWVAIAISHHVWVILLSRCCHILSFLIIPWA